MNPFQPQILISGLKCCLNAELTREECLALFELISDPNLRQVIKATPKRITYTVEIDFGKGNLPLFVKAFPSASLWERAKGLLRPAIGKRAWKAAVRNSENGIPTACPVAFMMDSRSHTNYMVSEFLEGWERFDFFFRDRAGERRLCARDKRALLETVAGALRQFHNAGVYQPDAIAGNIMVRGQGSDWEVAFVDLDACTFPGHVSLKKRSKALGKLDASLEIYVSRTDRLRFLNAYAGHTDEMNSRENISAILDISRKR